MSINERREKEREELKRKILEASFTIIAHDGYEGFTIRKLADAIDYSPRTIYLYYQNKEDLLKALVEDKCKEAWEHICCLEKTRKKTPAIERIAEHIRGHIQTGVAYPQHYRVVIMLLSQPDYDPGTYQVYIEQLAKEQICSIVHSSDVQIKNAIWKAFITSLRGFTLYLSNEASKLTEAEIQLRIDCFVNIMMKGLENL